MTQKWTKLSSVFLWADPRTSRPSKLVKDCQDMKQIYQQWVRACCFKYPTMNTRRNTHTHMTEREKGRKEKERKKERGNHGPRKEEDKLALTLPEQSQEPHCVHSECHPLSWGGAPGGQEGAELSSPRSTSGSHLLKTHNTSRNPHPLQGCTELSPWSWVGREEKLSDQDWAPGRAPDEDWGQGLGGPPWRDPCTPCTGHCSPGTTPGGRSLTAAVSPGGPAGGPGTWLLRHVPTPAPGIGWGGSRTLHRTRVGLLGNPCAPSPQMPPQCLWIQFTSPWCPCWAEWAVPIQGHTCKTRMDN